MISTITEDDGGARAAEQTPAEPCRCGACLLARRNSAPPAGAPMFRGVLNGSPVDLLAFPASSIVILRIDAKPVMFLNEEEANILGAALAGAGFNLSQWRKAELPL